MAESSSSIREGEPVVTSHPARTNANAKDSFKALDDARPAAQPRADGNQVPDVEVAASFLAALDPRAASFTFQTFDDNADRKDPNLVRVLHGSLAEHHVQLVRLNAKGAGVFVTIKETDFKGRKKSNIVRARAVFVDLDGAPLGPVREWTRPHVIVESSPDKWHAYWLVRDMPLDQFEAAQKGVIARFDGDPSVHDLPRVMRLPGFAHCKGEAFVSRIVDIWDHASYSSDAFERAPHQEGNGYDHRYFEDVPPLIESLTAEQKEHLWSALKHLHELNPGDYDTWAVQVMLPLQSVDEGEQIFLAFSRLCPDKFDEAEARRKWEADRGNNRAHWKSILKKAQEAGWINPASNAARALQSAGLPGLQYILQNRIPLDIDEQAPEFILQDMILTGMTTVVGYTGIGKTVTVLTLMLAVAGLMETPGLPYSIRRKVLYLAEDDDQIKRLIGRWIGAGLIAKPVDEIERWFVPVRVTRRSPDDWQSTISEFVAVEAVGHNGEEWWPAPVVVFDTGAASFDIKKIEDNAEVSNLISHLKAIEKVPRWPNLLVSILIILHVPKYLRGGEAEAITAIGAQAWSADTRGTVILSQDQATGRRLLTLGKKRFETTEDVGQWNIGSELLPEIELATPWAAQFPRLGVHRSTARRVMSFDPLSRKDLAKEKQDDLHKNKLEAGRGKFRDEMNHAIKQGLEGVAFYAPGKRGGDGKGPKGFLFSSWPKVYPTKSKGDGETAKLVQQDLVQRYSGKPYRDENRCVVFLAKEFLSRGNLLDVNQ